MAGGVCTPTADRKQREVLHGWCPFPLLFHLGVQLVGIGVYHPEPDLSVNPEPADLTTRLSQLAPWTPPSLPPRYWDYRRPPCPPDLLYRDSRDPNSGPHSWVTTALVTESTPSPSQSNNSLPFIFLAYI